jgi:hypothetical protein
MLILLSPSKTLDYDSDLPEVETSKPIFAEQTFALIKILKQQSSQDLQNLMGISEKLSQLNYERYQKFDKKYPQKNSRACIFAFKGDVYDGLDVESLDKKAIERTNQHVRILSGLYGLLKPFDLLQPYRLEMGTKLANQKGKNLYEFWGELLTNQLNEEIEENGHAAVINLASNEYFKAVQPKKLNAPLITPTFKELKGNQYKVIGIHAKKARGMMTRHLMQQKNPTVDDIKRFSETGYRFNELLSSESELIFTRK